MIGSPNGVSKQRPFDRWFRYPAGFSPVALSSARDATSLAPGQRCVDPFAGSASAGTFALESGVSFIGLEAHPLIAQLGELKFARPGDPGELRDVGDLVVASARRRSVRRSVVDREPELVRRCFDDVTLTSLVKLRRSVDELDSWSPWAGHARWALIGTLRDVANVKVGWPYQRPGQSRAATYSDPVERFLARLNMMTEDLADAPAARGSRVVAGDSRLRDTWRAAMRGELADGCISSPPYLNNFDYADATRLELFFLGQADSWKEMCEKVRAPMLVATTQQTRVAAAASATESLQKYGRTSAAVEELTARLATERKRRRRGKEYDRVLPAYFLGLADVLASLLVSVKPGARCAWVVGDSAPYAVEIDTPALITQLAAEVGFEPLSDDSLRTRGERWRTNGSRHQVALTERMVVFRRPVTSQS